MPASPTNAATLVWEATDTGERLSLSFDVTLPQGQPKKVGKKQILIPMPWSFWQRERQARMPDVPQSALFRSFERTQNGLEFIFEAPFAFKATSDAHAKKITLEIQDLRPSKADIPETSNASSAHNPTVPEAASTPKATEDPEVGAEEFLPQPDPLGPVLDPDKTIARRIAPGQMLRNQIVWPELVPDLDTDMVADTSRPAEPDAMQPFDQGKLTVQDAGNVSDTGQPEQAQHLAPALNATAVSAARTIEHVNNTDDLPLARATPTDQNQTLSTSEDRTPSTVLRAVPSIHANASVTTDLDDQTSPFAEVEEQLALARAALAEKKPGPAREIARFLLARPDLSDVLREELLYMAADIRMYDGQDDIPLHFPAILRAYEEAKNFNPKSQRMPELLAKIGHLHLSQGNAPEAKAHFDLLRRLFPDDPHVPLIDYAWGEYFAARGAYQQAADHFQYVLQNYPQGDVAQPSAIGLLKAMSELGFNDKAHALLKKIEEQWPDSGVKFPFFLMSAGYAALMVDELDEAKKYFWRYYNLVPNSTDADVALVRIGDIFIKTGDHAAARTIFRKTITDFPIREGGLVAQMRLAEEGLLDPRDSADRSALRRTELDPEKVYTQILEKTQGDLAPVARLKLAILHLRNKEYAKALDQAAHFAQDYPRHEFLPKNREVQDKALTDWILTSLDQGQFQDVLGAWDKYGEVFQDRTMDPGLRLAVATAMLENKDLNQGLDMLAPLVFDKPRSALAEQGLDLFLAHQMEAKNWPAVVRAIKEASTWGLSADKQRVLDYTAALAHENLEEHSAAKALWSKLSTNMQLPEEQRAYALYFLAREAMASEDVERAGILAQEALALLVKNKTDFPKIKDCLEMLIRSAEASGRDQDALSWILQAEEYMHETDPAWAAFIYRKALLYKKLGEQDKWRGTVKQLVAVKPDDLYSRMAASELEAQRLEQAVQELR